MAKMVIFSLLSFFIIFVVPRAGLEPATLGLEVLCSIHLSYQGMAPREPKVKNAERKLGAGAESRTPITSLEN